MRSIWVRIVAWFLAVSYGPGAVVTVWLEYRNHLFSERFLLPPGLIYSVSVVQFVCAIAVLKRPLAPWAAIVLTGTTLGAIWAHLRIGSPQTAVAAIVYTALQIWFAWQHLRARSSRVVTE